MRKLLLIASLMAASVGLMVVHAPEASAGPIFVFRRSDGSITFTSKLPPPGTKAEVFTPGGGRFSYYRGITSVAPAFISARSHEFHDIIVSYARRYGLDPSLVKGVIHAESAFNVRAVSPKGAQGLMQLMPDTARLLGVRNPFQPQQNIAGGTLYLSQLVTRYSGNVKLALAAYNAGPGAVEKYGGIPPYRETQQYVQRVLQLAQRYRVG